MAELEPQAHGGALYRPAKGETANPNGRPKKIFTILKESGYSKDDIRTAFELVAWLTESEAEEIHTDPTKPMVLKVAAMAFLKGAKKGDFRYISEIMSHVIGKPKETVEQKVEGDIVHTLKIEILKSGLPPATSEKDVSI